jgi:outer membrane protein
MEDSGKGCFKPTVLMGRNGLFLLLSSLLAVPAAGADTRGDGGSENLWMLDASTAVAEQSVGGERDDTLWHFRIGTAAYTAPKYEGGRKYKTQLIPIVDVAFSDRLFISTVQGAGVYIINESDWKVGVLATYESGRKEKEKESDLLHGLGDIDGHVNAGVFTEWSAEPFSFSMQALKGTHEVKGAHITAAAAHGLTFFERLRIEHSLSVTYADARYNRSYFGISAEQSANSQRHYRQYKAGAGIKDLTFSASVSYAVTPRLSADFITEYKRLTGPAAKSPLVRAGTKNQALVGIGVSYTF